MNKKFTKIAAFASALVLTLSATSVAYAAENGNSTETTASTDATAMKESTSDNAKALKIVEYGDLVKDGKVDTKDAIKVLQFYAEKIVNKELTIDKFLSGDSKETTESTEAATTTAATTADTKTTTTVEATEATTATSAVTTSVSTAASTDVSTAASTDASTEAATEITYSIGDVNGDGSVDTKDAILILQYYADSILHEGETAAATESTEVSTTAVTTVAATTTVAKVTTTAKATTIAAATTAKATEAATTEAK